MQILTPVGFDTPQKQLISPQVPNLPQPDTSGLQMLAQANQGIQSNIEAQRDSQRAQARAMESTLSFQSTSTEQISRAAALASQTSANRAEQTAQSWRSLNNTLAVYLDSLAKKDENLRKQEEELRKQYMEQQKAAAITELESQRVDWIEGGRIDQEGTVAYREQIGSTLAKYMLDPSTIGALTQTYYAPAVDYAKKTETNRIEAAAKLTEQQRRYSEQGLMSQLSGALGGLAASGGLDPSVVQGHYDNINTALTNYLKNEDVPLVDRLQNVTNALTAVNDVMRKYNTEDTEIRRNLEGFQSTIEYANELQGAVLSGQLSINDYNNQVRAFALSKNLRGFDPPDPSAPTRFLKDVLSTSDDIRELQQKQAMNDIQAVAANRTVISSLATQFAIDPASLAAVKAQDQRLLDVNAKAAIDVAEQFIKWRDQDIPQYQRRRASIRTDIASIQNNFNQWFVQQSLRGNAGGIRPPSEEKILEQLRIGGVTPEMLQGQKELTPEQAQLVKASTQELINAKIEEANVLDTEFISNRTKFGQYGLDLNPQVIKENNKLFEKQRKSYNEQLQEIRSRKLESPYEQPGNSPNFNGGSPRSPGRRIPFAKQQYDGKTITMPFPQGTNVPPISAGQKFNAPRPHRNGIHEGIDFAVPIGTPLISLTYGEVVGVGPRGGYGNHIEVRGDDGFIYLYAHLDKMRVKKGDRVGSGQQIGTTGNTGVGSGPHLHLEVSQGEAINLINPTDHLASRVFGQPSRRLRSASNNSAVQMYQDVRAIPLGGDRYLLDGKVISMRKFRDAQFPSLQFPSGFPEPDRITPPALQTFTGLVNGVRTQLAGDRTLPVSLDGKTIYVEGTVKGRYIPIPRSDPRHPDYNGGGRSPLEPNKVVTRNQPPQATVDALVNLRGRGRKNKLPSTPPQSQVGSPEIELASYSAAAPLRRNADSGEANLTRKGGNGAMGYRQLQKDTDLAMQIHSVASNLGIPSTWLADLIAYESAGTFSASIANGSGYYGLIQFGSSAMKDLGVTKEYLTGLKPAQQMKYVEKYLRLQMRYAGIDRFKNVAELIAAVNQGHTVLKDVRQRGASAINDSRNSDGAGTTLKKYLENLGKYSGRRYTFQGDRRARLTNPTHTDLVANCLLCNELQAQTTFVPHEAEMA